MDEAIKKELKWYAGYMGKRYFRHFIGLLARPEMFKEFVDKKVDKSRTTLVYCTDGDKLNKFIAFFLSLKHRNHLTESMYDFASSISNRDEDYFEKELTILYNHKHENLLGNTENWMIGTVLNKVATRNRDEKITLVATERPLKQLEESGEFQCVSLESSYKMSSSTNISTVVKINASADDKSGNPDR